MAGEIQASRAQSANDSVLAATCPFRMLSAQRARKPPPRGDELAPPHSITSRGVNAPAPAIRIPLSRESVVPASVAPVLAARRQGPGSRVAKPGRVTIIDLICGIVNLSPHSLNVKCVAKEPLAKLGSLTM